MQADPKRAELLDSATAGFREMFFGSSAGTLRPFVRNQFRKYYFGCAPAWRVAIRSLSPVRRMVPSFAITGATRCGTTSLASRVLQHPGISLPLCKEPDLRGTTMAQALANFPECEGGKITGFCAPLSPSASCLFRLKAISPGCKLVVLLRNPIDRAISQWCWDAALRMRRDPISDYEPGLVESLLREARGDLEPCTLSGASPVGYLRQSVYAPWLRLAFELFGRSRVMAIRSEDYFANAESVTAGVFDFIGLPRCETFAVRELNTSTNREIPASVRAECAAYFARHNEELSELLGEDMKWT